MIKGLQASGALIDAARRPMHRWGYFRTLLSDQPSLQRFKPIDKPSENNCGYPESSSREISSWFKTILDA